jgi:hypothetical protein
MVITNPYNRRLQIQRNHNELHEERPQNLNEEPPQNLTMGPQSQRRHTLKQRARNRSLPTPRRQPAQQPATTTTITTATQRALNGEVAFDRFEHCKPCKEGPTNKKRHHAKCIRNRATRGLSIAAAEYARRAEALRAYMEAAPQPHEMMNLRHTRQDGVHFFRYREATTAGRTTQQQQLLNNQIRNQERSMVARPKHGPWYRHFVGDRSGSRRSQPKPFGSNKRIVK